MAKAITATEFSALEALERMYGLSLTLIDRYGVVEDLGSIKQEGRYSSGTWTIKEMLDRADEVLERAKQRKA